MTEENEYIIKTIEDVLELTPEQFERFIPDLIDLHETVADLRGITEVCGTHIGFEQFTWIDDGELNINIKFKGEENE